jgi:hypothetical protein
MKVLGRLSPALFGAFVAAGCDPSARTRAAGECSQPVIVAFAAAPSDALFADLERASGARLEARAALTTLLYAMTVVGDGPQNECEAAVDQLRGDERVRSVDLDATRGPHSPGATPKE